MSISSSIFQFPYKHLDFRLKHDPLKTPVDNEIHHKFDEAIQPVLPVFQHSWDGSSHLNLSPSKQRLQHHIEYWPVVLPRLGSAVTGVDCKDTKQILWSCTQYVTWDSVCCCLEALKKLKTFLADFCVYIRTRLYGQLFAWLFSHHGWAWVCVCNWIRKLRGLYNGFYSVDRCWSGYSLLHVCNMSLRNSVCWGSCDQRFQPGLSSCSQGIPGYFYNRTALYYCCTED